ncbi:MAG: hypothetical protein ACYC4J_11165, partial [Gemmatimonadaceae bacterium]
WRRLAAVSLRPLRDGGKRTREALAHLTGDLGDAIVLRERERGHGVHGAHRDARTVLPHDDVAGEEGADLRFGEERLVREAGIAGAEDDLRRRVDAELVLQRGGDVDLRDDPEALLQQLSAGAGDDGLVVARGVNADDVGGWGRDSRHWDSPRTGYCSTI